MPALIDLDDAKRAVNVCFSDDDQKISDLVDAASAMVIAYLKGRAPAVLGVDAIGDSPITVPAHVAAATRYLVAMMYRTPDNDSEEAFADGMLPKPVRAMLAFDRDPTMA